MIKPTIKSVYAASDYVHFGLGFDWESNSLKVEIWEVIDGLCDFLGVQTIKDISYYETFVRFLHI